MQRLSFCDKKLLIFLILYHVMNSEWQNSWEHGYENEFSEFWYLVHSLQIILIKLLNFLNSSFLICNMGNKNTHEPFFFLRRIKWNNLDKHVFTSVWLSLQSGRVSIAIGNALFLPNVLFFLNHPSNSSIRLDFSLYNSIVDSVHASILWSTFEKWFSLYW